MQVTPWYTLAVLAAPARHDTPTPQDYGTNLYLRGTGITNSVTTPADEAGGVRYLCTGWTGTGSVPAAGASNSVTFTITNNSTLTWLWTNQYLVVHTNIGGWILGDAPGWWAHGLVISVTPSNGLNLAFSHWETNGINAGTGIPLTIAVTGPLAIEGVFTGAYMDVTSETVTEFTSWVLNRQTGTMFGDLILSNRIGSAKVIVEPFHYAVTRTTRLRLMNPDGTTPDGKDYVDVTAQVLAALPGAGNGDLALDPGEWVIVRDIEFYSYDRSVPAGYTFAVWADPPGSAPPDLSLVDTDGDGIPNGWEDARGLSRNDPHDGGRDPDGDGVTSFEEFIADTDPYDANSCLRLRGVTFSAQRLLLEWTGGETATQYVEHACSLNGPWQAVHTNHPPMNKRNSIDLPSAGERGFFRIRARR
jgi:hypothetical protein